MKVLFLVSCALATAFASRTPIYHGTQHIPVIHKGVPVDTPEVQHAREAHLAAVAKASVHSYEHKYGGDSYKNNHENHYDNHDNHYDNHDDKYSHEHNYDGHGYENSHDNHYDNHDNHYEHHDDHYDNHDNHYDNHNNHYDNHDNHYDNHDNKYGYSIKHVSHPVVYAGHDEHKHIAPVYHKLAYPTSYGYPQIGHDGKPLDTPEVESAKAHHFAAVHKALGLTPSQGSHYRKRRSLYTVYPQHIPVINHKGVPVEPLEVQHARAEHLAAHKIASYSKSYGYSTHQVHAPVYGHRNSYEYFIPKYDHEGHPLDTAEVEHAKAAHFAAYHKIAAEIPYNYGSYGYH